MEYILRSSYEGSPEELSISSLPLLVYSVTRIHVQMRCDSRAVNIKGADSKALKDIEI
jgi:hypothetical protein